MKYEELVKRLRDISNSDSKIKSNYIGLTMLQAADAIEGLEEKAQALAETLYAYEHRMPLPKPPKEGEE